MVIDPCIVPKYPSTRTCKPPLCASCQIARTKRRSTDVATTTVREEALLKVSDLLPGDTVSVDQYESSVRGRLATTRGRESFGHKAIRWWEHLLQSCQRFYPRFSPGCLSLHATDTVVLEQTFERNAKSCGVKVQNFHGDNGVFKSKEFTDSLTKTPEPEQEFKFSGVGVHHQNGNAQRNIRTVTEKACTMMQHRPTYIHWLDKYQVQLWPFALNYACWRTCSRLGMSIIRSKSHSPRWKEKSEMAPRARRGQFLGFSKHHSSMIGILRNI